MNIEEIKSTFLKIIEDIIPEINYEEIDTDKLIFEDYGISSFNLIKIIVSVENFFNIVFEDDELATTYYRDFDDIIKIIFTKVNNLHTK